MTLFRCVDCAKVERERKDKHRRHKDYLQVLLSMQHYNELPYIPTGRHASAGLAPSEVITGWISDIQHTISTTRRNK